MNSRIARSLTGGVCWRLNGVRLVPGTALSGPADRARPAMRLHRFKVQVEPVQHLADGNTQVGLLVNPRVHARAVLGADDLAVAIDFLSQALDAVKKFAGLGQDFAAADVTDLVLGLYLR